MGLPPFEDVVTAHGATVLRVCRVVVGPVDAEDAWSETFLAALRAYPRLRPDSDVKAWLVTVAHRKAIDIVRARARHAIPVDEVAEPRRVTVDDPVAATVAAGDDALLAAVRDLPDKQRHVVAYRYLADLAYDDIADLVGGSVAAARRSAADGIAALRATYSDPAAPREPAAATSTRTSS